MQSIYGMPIFITPDLKRELPAEVLPGVPWPPGFKQEIDAWMAGFFKPKNLMEDDQVVKTPDGLYMNPRTYKKLNDAIAQL